MKCAICAYYVPAMLRLEKLTGYPCRMNELLLRTCVPSVSPSEVRGIVRACIRVLRITTARALAERACRHGARTKSGHASHALSFLCLLADSRLSDGLVVGLGGCLVGAIHKKILKVRVYL